MSGARPTRAVVTAGGRLDPALAALVGAEIKALAPIGGVPLLARVLAPLQSSPRIGEIAVVGAIDSLRPVAGGVHLVPDTGRGIGNVLAGIDALGDPGNDDLLLVSASDVPFLTVAAVHALLDDAPGDADLVFPVIEKRGYEAVFPQSPNTWARLKDGALTGGSVILVRPSAMRKLAALAEMAFSSRKSQWEMAKLLGPGFVLKFVSRTLSVRDAEARVSHVTKLNCRALMGADPRLACDVDGQADFDYAQRYASGGILIPENIRAGA